ncbi:uncharacterized protein isoform X2 [Musca autumnalis]|uniref:uncharacterized protein isoform X2 n=1 Tax=Musca autumnalis TaxID=221902 RepID=UPI003CEB5FF7
MNDEECGKNKSWSNKNGNKNRRTTMCSSKLPSKVSKQTHIIEEITQSGDKRFHCTACQKSFKSRTQKYYHLECNQLHEQLFKCDNCPKTFSRQSQLKYHRESHASPVNKCTKCEKTFSNPLALKKHEGLHKVEPKPCPHCDKTFLKKTSLQEHIAGQHMHNLQYGCATCNKRYSSKSTLQLHVLSHEKKRFECTLCGKHFQRNSILNLHLKRHYQSASYRCNGCEKVFSEPGALSRHRKIHEDSIRYHCLLCDLNILRKDNMTRHIKTIHPDENYEDIVKICKPNTAHKPNEQLSLEITENKTEMQRQQHGSGHDKDSDSLESSRNVVIIENKLIRRPSGGNQSNQQILNQIHVITALPPPTTVETDTTNWKNEKPAEINLQDLTYENHIDDEHNWRSSKCTENLSSKHEYHHQLPEISNIQDMNVCTNMLLKESEPCTVDTVHSPNPIVVHPPSVICSVGNVSKKLTFPFKETETITTNQEESYKTRTEFEYKHKKYNHHYNVDLYRKILGLTGDDEDDNHSVEDNNANSQSEEEQRKVIKHPVQDDNPPGNTNGTAAALHWRKSFKHIYETSSM